MTRLPVLLTVLLGLLAFAGCGESTDDAASPEVITVTEKQVVTAPTATSAPRAATAPVTKPAKRTKPAKPTSAGIAVPSVVGKNHQYAQDTMQAAGLYNLTEEDATGQGRFLLWDRNWVVVSQSPEAGSRVTEDTTITLRSKKYGE